MEAGCTSQGRKPAPLFRVMQGSPRRVKEFLLIAGFRLGAEIPCVDAGRENSLSDANAAWVTQQGSGASGPLVLIAEDSEAHIFFLLRAFAAAGLKNPVFVVRSGAEALEYLSGVGKYADREKYPMPGVVFIDLKMPKPDGLDVLRWKEGQMRLPRILWVAVSNFDGVKTINEAYTAGATTFLAKPLDAMDVRNLVDAFEEYWKTTGAPNKLEYDTPQVTS